MEDILEKLPEADDARALSYIETLRTSLRGSARHPRAGAPAAAPASLSGLDASLFLTSVQLKLRAPRAPSEDVTASLLHALADFVAAAPRGADLHAVADIATDAIPLLARDKPRRAAGALLAALLRRAPETGTALSASIANFGLQSDSVRRIAGHGSAI
jgi:plasmid stabilization system protein ParE